MYIKRIEIENVRSISHLIWELRDDDDFAGWHILIGDNGSGKSTVLRSAALALVGAKNAEALRQNWSDWLARRKNEGSIMLDLIADELYDKDTNPKDDSLFMGLSFERDQLRGDVEVLQHLQHFRSSRILYSSGYSAWDDGKGWFSTAYGPFRRFTGGNQEYRRIFEGNPRLAGHLSVFGEDVALADSIEWLKELKFKKLEDLSEGDLLDPIIQFINQKDFLPHGTQLIDVSSKGVTFKDANGASVPVENLSDGFRSILSMTFEIIRQLQIAYPDTPIFSKDFTQVILPGVVLIDEVDAHLHPEWQRRIGFWLTQHFPMMQFIVTTHSPLICQAASRGSIWRLRAPGEEGELSAYRVDKDDPKTAEEWKRLVYGNILEAYSTDLFGEHIDRSAEAQAKFERVAELSAKEQDEPLSPAEEHELESLMDELPNTPYKHIVEGGND